jgi:hypothetical protein
MTEPPPTTPIRKRRRYPGAKQHSNARSLLHTSRMGRSIRRVTEHRPATDDESEPRTLESDQNRILRQGNWIQRFIAAVLLVAAIIALLSMCTSERTARLAQADATWERYMEFAFQNPGLETGNFNFRDGTSPADVRYAWFVERGLFAGDQIVAIAPDDPQWQDAIAWEVDRHKRYILSNTFLLDSPPRMSSFCTYRRHLRDIIVRTLGSDPRAARRLNVAETRCRTTLRERGLPDG